MKIELASGIELEAKAISDDGLFEGYASVFGVIDSHRDQVLPGAFTKSLAARPIGRVKMLRQHDQAEPIGVWTAAAEDSRGLHVKGRIIRAVARGLETFELMRAGALDRLSIGFRTVRDRFEQKSRSRQLIEIDLREISIVTFGSNDEAIVSAVKSAHDTERDERIVAALQRASAALR